MDAGGEDFSELSFLQAFVFHSIVPCVAILSSHLHVASLLLRISFYFITITKLALCLKAFQNTYIRKWIKKQA